MKRRTLTVLGIVLGVAVVGFLTFPFLQARLGEVPAQASYQTEAARRGAVSVEVGGTGAVRANQSAALVWQTTGKVARVVIEKGQRVQADALLAELEPASLPQNVLQAQIDLVNARDALDQAINNSEARANAHLALIQAQQALDDAEEEAQSKLYRRASQETIDIARANLINANEALDQAENIWEAARGAGDDSPVYAAGLSQVARARQEQQRADYNLRYVEALPDPLSVEEANIKVDQARAQLLTAKENWEKVKDGPDEDEVRVAQVRLEMAQAALDLARLSAPFSGTITQVESQPGDLVSGGLLAVKIDDLSRLWVDVEISEVDIRQVAEGQLVSMTFDALPGQTFDGLVSDIAAAGSTVGGTVNFTVRVEIIDPPAEVRPGMTAAVNITVSRLDDVLLVPSRAVRTVDGQRVVYVVRENLPVAVEIGLGASANNYSQVTSGDLKEGDQVILNPSTSTMPVGPIPPGGPGQRNPFGGG